MINIILILVIVVIIASAVIYIVREKKRGVKCIGCPHAKQCASRGKCSSKDERNKGV